MTIRLLDKKTVNTEVATQKRQQIEQGIALAKKVDAVRATLSKEEAQLTEFRIHTIATTQKEIDAKVAEKDSLIKDIRSLKEKRAALLVPLDAEWGEVRKEKESVSGLKQGLFERKQRLAEREQQVTTMEKEAQDNIGRADSLRKQAAESLVEAESTLSHAKEAAAKMRNDAQTTLLMAELKNTEAAEREDAVLVREKEIDTNWQRIRGKEAELARKEKQLIDREQTLARSIKRLGL